MSAKETLVNIITGLKGELESTLRLVNFEGNVGAATSSDAAEAKVYTPADISAKIKQLCRSAELAVSQITQKTWE